MPAALTTSLTLLAAIFALTVVLEKRRHGKLIPGSRSSLHGWRRLIQGPWPLVWGAVALAFGNFATLYLAGRPWSITSALALWGSKLLFSAGVDVGAWPYWQGERLASLQQNIFHDVTTIMDFGIMAGALLAAAFRPEWRIQPLSLLGAILGGLLLGYGARLVWLQYWRLLRWHRLREPAWLVLGRRHLHREHFRNEPPPSIRAERRASPIPRPID